MSSYAGMFAAVVLMSTTLIPPALAQTKNYGRKEIKCESSKGKVAVTMTRRASDRVGQEIIMRSGWRAKISHASAVTDTIAILSSEAARCSNNRLNASPAPERACGMDMDCGQGGRCLPLPGFSAVSGGQGVCDAPKATTPAPAKSTAPKHKDAGCQALREEYDAKDWQVHVVGTSSAKVCTSSAKKDYLKAGTTTSARHAKTKITDCKLVACPR